MGQRGRINADKAEKTWVWRTPKNIQNSGVKKKKKAKEMVLVC